MAKNTVNIYENITLKYNSLNKICFFFECIYIFLKSKTHPNLRFFLNWNKWKLIKIDYAFMYSSLIAYLLINFTFLDAFGCFVRALVGFFMGADRRLTAASTRKKGLSTTFSYWDSKIILDSSIQLVLILLAWYHKKRRDLRETCGGDKSRNDIRANKSTEKLVFFS